MVVLELIAFRSWVEMILVDVVVDRNISGVAWLVIKHRNNASCRRLGVLTIATQRFSVARPPPSAALVDGDRFPVSRCLGD